MTTRQSGIIAAILIIALIFSLVGRLFAGAPIPVDPHYIILTDKVAVRNAKPVMIWTKAKQYRNDRVFAGGFQNG